MRKTIGCGLFLLVNLWRFPSYRLFIFPPTHPTCERCSTDDRGEQNCFDDCFVYSDNRHCPLTIKSELHQISYEITWIDIDPTNNGDNGCGDYLSIIGFDEKICGYGDGSEQGSKFAVHSE
ncbi:Oidioi.mRNA.OKI2018_I69.chr1.g1369.t1.cds [Oikopleura dioica]|uniref:Oidioi.mRNA.OKI2018_I69.chr1.g1369.t1.cds n=1 Tax=Oikopleura dioica TaxID=34765 RepID=A0ABN7SRY7_OIKDI|nr:Oidioi.mRNA.OKI2018_I69.chr1.g1369.t1.cds [Oikopleura dioica]